MEAGNITTAHDNYWARKPRLQEIDGGPVVEDKCRLINFYYGRSACKEEILRSNSDATRLKNTRCGRTDSEMWHQKDQFDVGQKAPQAKI